MTTGGDVQCWKSEEVLWHLESSQIVLNQGKVEQSFSVDYTMPSCYNGAVMGGQNSPGNSSSWMVTVVAVCVFLLLSSVGLFWLLSDSQPEEEDVASGIPEVEEDSERNDSNEDVAGLFEESDDALSQDGSEEKSNADSGDEQTSQESQEELPNPPSRPPIVTPIVKPDPAVAEFLTGYLPIHQKDELSHTGENFSFQQVPSEKFQRNLSVMVDYVPPTNPYLNKTVLGFAPYWVLNDYTEYQMERLSVIAYFSVAVYPDGTFVTTCVNGYCGDKYGWDGWNSVELADMITKAHEEGVKVVLTIKNFDKASIENLITSPTAQSNLIVNILSELSAKNADGVNIDYEYIGIASPELRAAFASSMNAIADAVHAARPGSHVSTDILGSSAMSQLLYDVTALGQTSLDSIMVMAYDFYSTRYYDGKFAAPTSPLYGDQYWYTVSEAMLDIIARAPAGKVIMGVPYYGLEFPVSGTNWGSKNASVVSSGAITTYANVMDPVFDAWHNISTIQWDEGEKMTWYRYRWPDAVMGPEYWQGYYDDARSIRAKYDFVMRNGIGGVGIWALGYDAGRSELWTVLREAFSKEPIVVLFKTGVLDSQQQAIHAALSAEVVSELANGRGVIVRPTTVTSQQLIAQYNARVEVAGAGFLPYRSLSVLDDL
jgi:spore germination protein YaaH